MRQARRLTTSEQWDLGLLLFMFIVGSLCLTVIWRSGALPRLAAFAFHKPAAAPEVTLFPAAPPAAIAISPAPMPPLQLADAPQVLPAQVPELQPTAPVPQKAVVKTKPAIQYKYFNGEKYRYVKTIRMRVTAYAPDKRCCWPYDGTTTASGLSVKTNHGKLVAADTRVIPFHSLVSIPGYHAAEAVPVLDRGGAIKGHRLDVLFPTFDQAQDWGSRLVDVKIYQPVNNE